jgi:uncharacterized protein (UPF0335 family)
MANTQKSYDDDDNDNDSAVVSIDGAAGKRLKSFIDRIERLEEEKKGLADDIKEIYAEAKSVGFDPKIMRKLIRLMKMEPQKRSEEDMLLETYKAAIGIE